MVPEVVWIFDHTGLLNDFNTSPHTLQNRCRDPGTPLMVAVGDSPLPQSVVEL